MNVLILTAKFGMGHVRVAEAIKQDLEKDNNGNIEIIDFYDFFFKNSSKIFYNLYDFMISKCSKLYNFSYCISSKLKTGPVGYKFNEKLNKILSERNIDIIISTFPSCSRYVSKYIEEHNPNVKLYTYITDIYANNEWVAKNTEYYFVAADQTKKQLIQYGVNENRIIISGIPVKTDFRTSSDKDSATDILIMGGCLGVIKGLDDLINKIKHPQNIHITIIAGKNKRILKKYKDKYENISVIGFTNDIAQYMKKAKIIITKPGGITLFEAINLEVPICSVKPFLVQEIGNANYILYNQIGVVNFENDKNLLELIVSLIEKEDVLKNMSINMKKLKKDFCKDTVIDFYSMEEENIKLVL